RGVAGGAVQPGDVEFVVADGAATNNLRNGHVADSYHAVLALHRAEPSPDVQNVPVRINNVNSDIDFVYTNHNRSIWAGDCACGRYTGLDGSRWFVEEWGRGSIRSG